MLKGKVAKGFHVTLSIQLQSLPNILHLGFYGTSINSQVIVCQLFFIQVYINHFQAKCADLRIEDLIKLSKYIESRSELGRIVDSPRSV